MNYLFLCFLCIFQNLSAQSSLQDTWHTVRSWFTGGLTEESTQTHTLKPGERILLTLQRGNVTLDTWNKPDIRIQATKRATSEEQLATLNCTTAHKTSEDDEVECIITAHQPQGGHIDYDVLIPIESPLRIIIQEEGSITIKQNRQPLSVSTQKGTITIEQARTPLEAHTNEGSIALTLVSVDTTVLCTTGTGSVTLKLPSATTAQLDAITRNGTVTSTIPITLEPITTTLTKETRKQMARTARGTIGAESEHQKPLIKIDVARGNIEIKEIKDR